MVHKISSVEGNLFTFGLICYFCPGSQKINILTAQYKQACMEYVPDVLLEVEVPAESLVTNVACERFPIVVSVHVER